MGDGDNWSWCAASLSMRSEATVQRPGSGAAVRAQVVLTLGLPDAAPAPYNENRQWSRGPFLMGDGDAWAWFAASLTMHSEATEQRSGCGTAIRAPVVLTLGLPDKGIKLCSR